MHDLCSVLFVFVLSAHVRVFLHRQNSAQSKVALPFNVPLKPNSVHANCLRVIICMPIIKLTYITISFYVYQLIIVSVGFVIVVLLIVF